VPEKYVNNRQSFTAASKFDDEPAENSKSKDKQSDEPFESIREKKKAKNKRPTETNNFQYGGVESETLDSTEYFKDEQLKLELVKQKNIEKFLFVKIAAPRSPRMVDRLKLKDITVGKGKMFGPEDYFSFAFLTIFIIIFFLDRKRQYKTYSYENLENVNIYNALKPSEVVKIYEDNEISPTEQIRINSKEHIEYKQEKLLEEIKDKVKHGALIGKINDVPKLDIKNKFKDSLNK
jgi:hypothetical protein